MPPDWYEKGIRNNLGQRFWHFKRFSEVGKLINSSGGKILDIGSADGTFTKIILDKSCANKVIGVDVLESSVSYASNRFIKNKRLEFIKADANKLPFKKDEFDAVFCLEVLEHVFSPKKVIEEVRRVLKNDGYAVFLVPSENLLFKFIWFFWVNTGGKVWQGTHLHHFNHHKLADLAKKNNFLVLKEKIFLLGMLKAVKIKKK